MTHPEQHELALKVWQRLTALENEALGDHLTFESVKPLILAVIDDVIRERVEALDGSAK